MCRHAWQKLPTFSVYIFSIMRTFVLWTWKQKSNISIYGTILRKNQCYRADTTLMVNSCKISALLGQIFMNCSKNFQTFSWKFRNKASHLKWALYKNPEGKLQTLTIDNNRHCCCTALKFKANTTWNESYTYSSVRKRLSLALPCWKLAGKISYRPFCTASAFCCMLSIFYIYLTT